MYVCMYIYIWYRVATLEKFYPQNMLDLGNSRKITPRKFSAIYNANYRVGHADKYIFGHHMNTTYISPFK